MMKIWILILISLLTSACSIFPSKPTEVDLSNPPWHFNRIHLKNAWNITKGENSLVMLCDTGVSDFKHEIPTIIERKNYLNINDPSYLNDIVPELHGTLTAGIISGLHGVAPKSKIISYRVSNEKNGITDNGILSECIRYAIEKKVDVISMSYDHMCYDNDSANIVEEAVRNNIIMVVASGNDMSEDHDAIDNPDVICVASSSFKNQNDLSYVSNWGKDVDITAPGEYIQTYNNQLFFGTSSAVPIISATIALMKSVNKDLDVYDIDDIFRLTAEDLGILGKDIRFGYGMINVDKAVEMAKNYKRVAVKHQ